MTGLEWLDGMSMGSTVRKGKLTGMQRLNGLLRVGGVGAEEGLTCGTFTGLPAFASSLLTLWFGAFRGVCAWNSRVF